MTNIGAVKRCVSSRKILGYGLDNETDEELLKCQ